MFPIEASALLCVHNLHSPNSIIKWAEVVVVVVVLPEWATHR